MGYLGHRTASTDAGASLITIDKPTECVEGGWLFALLNSNFQEGTHTIVPLELGWTEVHRAGSSSTSATKSHAHLFRKKVEAADAGTNGAANYTFDVQGGNRTFGATIITYDGLDPANPVVGFAFNGDAAASDTSIPCDDVSTTEPNQYVIRAATIRATASFTELSGYTERVDFQPPVSIFSLNWQEDVQPTAGAAGATTITSSASGEHVGITLVLKTNTQITTLLADGVAAQSGYANATTGNIANLHGDPDSPGGTGFLADTP